ncbi:hypothetical protein AR274_20245 [Stenotrophomonas maltophilia]|nr:hypothetical protein AR274_20245 [Stenotrophomonas maltophilia]
MTNIDGPSRIAALPSELFSALLALLLTVVRKERDVAVACGLQANSAGAIIDLAQVDTLLCRVARIEQRAVLAILRSLACIIVVERLSWRRNDCREQDGKEYAQHLVTERDVERGTADAENE